MSVTVANISLAGAVVGQTGKISFGPSLMPPPIEQQMRPQDAAYATLFVYNESPCELLATFPSSVQQVVIPAGAWKRLAVPPLDIELDYLVDAVMPGGVVFKLYADLYLPGESLDDIGTIGNSPVGGTANVAITQQVDGTFANTTTPQVLTQTPNIGISIDNFAAGNVLEIYPATTDLAARGVRFDYRDTGGALHGGVGIDNTGHFVSTGAVGSVGSQAATGNFGVPLIVAQALSVNVVATTLQTILSYAVTSTGFYRVQSYLRLNNGTSGQKAALSVLYTDPDTSLSTGFNFVTPTAVVAVSGVFVPTTLDGNQTLPNGTYATLAALVHVKTGTNLLCQYQDPLNTPNDNVTFIIERLA